MIELVPTMEIAAGDALQACALQEPALHSRAAQSAARLIAGLEADGLRVTVSHDLALLARRYRERGWHTSWLIDPALYEDASDPAKTIIVSLYKGGEFIGASAQRLVWVERSFTEACESLRFFFGRRLDRAPPGLQCRVTAPAGQRIRTCHVVYSCAFHVLGEEARGPRSVGLIRLAHAVAAVRWHFTWIVGRGTKAIADRYTERAYGFPGWESGIWLHSENAAPEERERHYLIYTPREHFLQQLIGPWYGDARASLADRSPLDPPPPAAIIVTDAAQ